MRAQLLVLLAVVGTLFGPSCSRRDFALQEATRTFTQRYPNYVLRRAKNVKCDEKVREVALEFDAPDNIKNRGHADLILRREENGSWKVIEERIRMWPE